MLSAPLGRDTILGLGNISLIPPINMLVYIPQLLVWNLFNRLLTHFVTDLVGIQDIGSARCITKIMKILCQSIG